MNCDFDPEQLSAWSDGELPASASAATEAHVAACTTCAEAVAQWRTVDAAVRDGNVARTPTTLRDRVATAAETRPALWRRWRWQAAAALVVAVALPVVTRVLRSDRPGEPAYVTRDGLLFDSLELDAASLRMRLVADGGPTPDVADLDAKIARLVARIDALRRADPDSPRQGG